MARFFFVNNLGNFSAFRLLTILDRDPFKSGWGFFIQPALFYNFKLD